MTSTNSVVTKSSVSRQRLSPSPIIRSALQLAGCLVVAVWVPSVIRVLLSDVEWTNPELQNTSLASCIAVIAGYVVYRRNVSISDTQAIKHTLVSLTSAFGFVLIILAFLVIEHDRYQLAIHYILAIGWYFGLLLTTGHIKPLRFFLAPGRGTQDLQEIPGADWRVLNLPDLPDVPFTGVVADKFIGPQDQWTWFIRTTRLARTPVFNPRQVTESLTGRVDIDKIPESSLGVLIPNQFYMKAKFAFDWISAFILLALLSPALLTVAIAIRIESPGPILCRQKYMGFRGQQFTLFTFRSTTGEPGTECTTRVGGILRRYRIDTLPQIINILCGEMSWIGPRPEPMPVFEQVQNASPLYRYRLIVRPGLNGWAQINETNLNESNDPCSKLFYDFYYIKHFSPWLDALTALRLVAKIAGRRACKS